MELIEARSKAEAMEAERPDFKRAHTLACASPRPDRRTHADPTICARLPRVPRHERRADKLGRRNDRHEEACCPASAIRLARKLVMWTAKGDWWPTHRASSETAMLCLGLKNTPSP